MCAQLLESIASRRESQREKLPQNRIHFLAGKRVRKRKSEIFREYIFDTSFRRS